MVLLVIHITATSQIWLILSLGIFICIQYWIVLYLVGTTLRLNQFSRKKVNDASTIPEGFTENMVTWCFLTCPLRSFDCAIKCWLHVQELKRETWKICPAKTCATAKYALRKKSPYSEYSVPYSVWMRKNTDQKIFK